MMPPLIFIWVSICLLGAVFSMTMAVYLDERMAWRNVAIAAAVDLVLYIGWSLL